MTFLGKIFFFLCKGANLQFEKVIPGNHQNRNKIRFLGIPVTLNSLQRVRKEDGVDEFTDGLSGLNCTISEQKADLTCEKAHPRTSRRHNKQLSNMAFCALQLVRNSFFSSEQRMIVASLTFFSQALEFLIRSLL